MRGDAGLPTWNCMVRGIALTGLAGGFLVISPKLRENAWDALGQVIRGMEQYSPLSYVGLAVALVLGFLAFLSASSGPR